MIRLLVRLSYEFAKTGLFAIGGGLATLPFLYVIGAKTGWFDEKDILNMIAISQSTPGPLGVNMATYVGFTSMMGAYKSWTAGIIGAVVAPTALVFPSVVIIIGISRILNKFKESVFIERIFYGLRPASSGLIMAAGLGVAKLAMLELEKYAETGSVVDIINYKSVILAAVIFGIMSKYKWHPVLLIAISAVAGIIFKF